MIPVAALAAGRPGTGSPSARFSATREDLVERASAMDEQSFRLFYDRSARPLQAFLISSTGNPSVAEDLLQETYFRFLRADVQFNDDDHRRNYLFRIATNLLRDRYRRHRPEVDLPVDAPEPTNHGDEVRQRTDLSRVLGELKPKERQMLWLAYVEGMSHREIAAALGLKTDSVRPLLYRARRRMAAVLHDRGWTP